MGEAARKQSAFDQADLVAAKVAGSAQLAVLPQVVCKISEIAGNDNSSVATLERAILVDPGLSARILTQANSAAYCLPRKVTSIRDAVILMGFKAVRHLAMTVGVFDLFVGKSDRESLRRRAWWRTSLDTAVVGQAVSSRWPWVGSDEAYTCGLLHLIGKTLLDRFDSRRYARVQEVVEKGVPDILAERALYQTDHVRVAHESARLWRLPDRLANGLDYVSPFADLPDSDLRAVLCLSHFIAEFAVRGKAEGLDPAHLVPQWVEESLGITEEDMEQLVKVGIQAIANAATMYM